MEEQYGCLSWTDDNGYKHVMHGKVVALQDDYEAIASLGWEVHMEVYA